MLLTACSGDEPTQTPESDESQPTSAPAVTVELPTPTPSTAPTPTPIVTPTFIPVDLPLPPTATPRPTPTLDPNVPSATPLPDIGSQLPTPRVDPHSLLLDDGRVLFAGGTLILFADDGQVSDLRPNPFLEIYDPESESWSLVQPVKWNLVDVSVTPLTDGNVLVLALQQQEDEDNIYWPRRLADDDSPLPLNTAFLLDVEAATMSEVSTATIPRSDPSLIPLDDGRIVVAGGIPLEIDEEGSGLPIVKGVEIYDPALNMWSMAAPFASDFVDAITEPTFQWFGRVGARVGHILIGEGEGYDSLGVLMFYDPAVNAWETADTFELERYDSPWHAMGSATGELYLFFTSRIEIYDPSSREWTYAYGPRGVPPISSVSELDDGRLLIAGGLGGDGQGWISTPGLRSAGNYYCWFRTEPPKMTTEIYDPSTGLWASGPDMSESQSCHSATVLPDGSVLLYAGVLIWEEDESNAVFTYSMEIIPAATLAAVDTVTPQAGGSINVHPWQTCISVANVEPLPASSTEIPATVDSAASLLKQSALAMRELESFATTTSLLQWESNDQQGNSGTFDPFCNYYENEYQKPDSYRGRWLTLDDRSPSSASMSIVVGSTRYSRESESDDWTWEGLDQEYDNSELIAFWVYLPVDVGDAFDSFRIVGIEDLDGSDVYHVSGQISSDGIETGNTISYWIGTDDLLLYRYYISADPGGEDAGSPIRNAVLTIFHSFNEDFDIRAPLTPEEAAHPKAFGWSRCQNLWRLEPLPQSSGTSAGVADSATGIVTQSLQAMDALTSYATSDFQRNRDTWNNYCYVELAENMQVNLMSSRRLTFWTGEVTSDIFRIVADQSEYLQESGDNVWTRQDYDSSERSEWPHNELLDLDFSDPEINLQIVGIETLDGVDVYHISDQMTEEETGDQEIGDQDGVIVWISAPVAEPSISLWITVEGLLLKRALVISRRELDGGSNTLVTHRLVEFHSFNQDFNIQPPPGDEIAD